MIEAFVVVFGPCFPLGGCDALRVFISHSVVTYIRESINEIICARNVSTHR